MITRTLVSSKGYINCRFEKKLQLKIKKFYNKVCHAKIHFKSNV